MIAANASSILQVGAVVLLAVGSGLVMHVLRLAETETEAIAPRRPGPAAIAPVEPPLRKAA